MAGAAAAVGPAADIVGRVEKADVEAVAARWDEKAGAGAVGVPVVPDMAGQAGRVAAGALVAPGMAVLAASADAGEQVASAGSGIGQALSAGVPIPFGLLAENLRAGALAVLVEGLWDWDIAEPNAARNHSRYPKEGAWRDSCSLRTFGGRVDAWSKGCDATFHVVEVIEESDRFLAQARVTALSR